MSAKTGGAGASLLQANSLFIPLRDNSVDLIVTSPPYFALRSYQDNGEHYDGQIGSEDTPAAFLTALWAVTDECWRVLKPSGSLFVNLGDKFAGGGGQWDKDEREDPGRRRIGKTGTGGQTWGSRPKSRMLLPHRYALGCVDPDYRAYVERVDRAVPQWICRMDMVWEKPNGMPESVTDRVRASHEYWFHLTRSERYYSNIDTIREPHETAPHPPGNRSKGVSAEQIRGLANASKGISGHLAEPDRQWGNPLGKLPGSVWSVASEPLTVPGWLEVDHYAAFPTEWPRRLILGWSPPGVCTVCGEGRRAAVEKTPMVWRESPTIAGRAAPGASRKTASGTMLAPATTTITGERCACPAPTATTRPAVVLDPFGGTGTTVMIARALGRHGVNIDLSADYLRLARWRINDSGHWDRAVERTTGRRCETVAPIPGQGNLFD